MKAKSALIATIATVGIASAANAQVWNETTNGGGDAGDLPSTHQNTVGSGALTSITGATSAVGHVDLYCINITNEAAFTAITGGAGGSTTDFQLFLFSTSGTAIVFNDDSAALGNLSAGLTSALVTANGLYLIGIGRFDSDALNLAGGTQAANGIWHDGAPYTGQYAPDGPGSSNPVLAGWATGTVSANYTITLTGAEYCAVPAPGALALLGLAGLLGKARRRR